jgi:DNA-binding transcriptional regulator YhcF (GntR family)
MFVSMDARNRLLEARRERFFEEVVDPMVEEAERIGVPMADIMSHIEKRKEEQS